MVRELERRLIYIRKRMLWYGSSPMTPSWWGDHADRHGGWLIHTS
jgi:hypothetical protein